MTEPMEDTVVAEDSIENRYSERERRVLRLWLRLVRTSRRVEAEVGAKMLHSHHTRFVRFDVLSQLYRAPDRRLSVGDLGASLLTPSGNISSLLDRMEADGLVTRIPDPADRRRFMIQLTDAGRETFDEMALANAQWVASAFEAIDDATLDRLYDALGEIAAIHE